MHASIFSGGHGSTSRVLSPQAEFFAGDLGGVLSGQGIDCKLFLGLFMWYQLIPDRDIPLIVSRHEQLMDDHEISDPDFQDVEGRAVGDSSHY